jgi:hypothetical protein
MNDFHFRIMSRKEISLLIVHHHHQPINVPTAEPRAFHMDHTQRVRAIAHYAGPMRNGGC